METSKLETIKDKFECPLAPCEMMANDRLI